jgi:hypothetical protein
VRLLNISFWPWVKNERCASDLTTVQTPGTYFQTGDALVALAHSKFASSSHFSLGAEFEGIFTLDLSPFLARISFHVNAIMYFHTSQLYKSVRGHMTGMYSSGRNNLF